MKNWFRSQMTKAKKFQPLAVLNQKFRGLDVFESNDAPPPPAAKISSGPSTPEPPRQVEPEELVSRTHWQRPSYNDVCSDPMCGKRLGAGNGSVNCRRCGKLFCDEHTMYQMKLSRSAQHEPVRGIWCRVCETCYKSRDGYNDHKGVEQDHTSEFTAIRRRTVDRQYLEVSRLEKRLSKLTQLLANPPPPQENNRNSFIWPLGGAKTQERELEQTVVDWQDDASVSKCPFCQQEFSSYSFRRHHCRTCGRVVCGDPKTKCSTMVGLNVAAPTPDSEKSQNQLGLDVRICKDCRHTLFSKADYDRELQQRPADQRTYENLAQFERGIRLLLPKFQRLLQALQYAPPISRSAYHVISDFANRDPDHPPPPSKIAEASKVRKRLTDSFIQYESAARRIRDLPTTSPTQARLQKAVYQQASNFLHLHMLPLKSLPRVLKHASPHGHGLANGKPNGALAGIRFNDAETASQISSSSAIESMEAEEKDLRERLIVLEEQKFIVSEMVSDARKKRRFDEEKSLSLNVEDLSREIDAINGQLATLREGFQHVYENMGSPAGVESPVQTPTV